MGGTTNMTTLANVVAQRSVRLILLPWLVDESHWVLVVLELDNNRVAVYDSMRSSSPFEPLGLHRLLRVLAIDSFTVVHPDCAQQTDGSSCGLFIVAFAHALAFNSSLTTSFDCVPM